MVRGWYQSHRTDTRKDEPHGSERIATHGNFHHRLRRHPQAHRGCGRNSPAGRSAHHPREAALPKAIEVIQRKIEYDEQTVAINAPIDAFIFDGAYAFHRVLSNKFGWVNNVPTPGFFGDKPPAVLSVPIGLNETVNVPWGRTVLPGIDGFLHTGASYVDGRFIFVIQGEVKRKHENAVQEIVKLVKDFVRTNSIYKGKAFRLRLRDDDGDPLPMPQPKFLLLDPKIEGELIFSDQVKADININIFTVIEQTARVRAQGVPLKRGILLSGPYGTGKSMTSTVTAVKAVRNGWTYIVCDRADELADVLRLAREWGPAVVFCEDIDRVMDGHRDIDMDGLLNVIDGVESKAVELMVVLTTNDVDRINQAMLRPGRLDAVIHVAPPDAFAAQKLMRHYGRGLIAPDADLSAAGELMSGQIPAVIRETVERSKLAAISSTSNDAELRVTPQNLIDASLSMRNQLDLLAPKAADRRSDAEKAASITGEAIRSLVSATPETVAAVSGVVNHGGKANVPSVAPKVQ